MLTEGSVRRRRRYNRSVTAHRLSRRQLLAAGLGLPALRTPSPAAGRRNVLFIAVDDLKPYLGCYGHAPAITPHIDRLAARGLTFTRAYCQQAVCSPSRTSLLTGRRPDTTRVCDLQTHFRGTIPDAVTLPEQFKRHGYATTGFSKIFHGGLDDARSWSIPSWTPSGPPWGSPRNAARAERLEASLAGRNWRGDPVPPQGEEDRKRRGPSWSSPDVADNELPDGKTADAVVAALAEMRGKPFFLAAGFHKPHLPFTTPKRYFDLYRDTRFTPAANPFPPKGDRKSVV